ncbi:MAG: GAF domain-containing protein [candidate division Zixibacteria bacterium]|nr:GAF domain-containing protein [candidate division Zixibacteria bacterium]MDH3936535.1 GAF domain-containing protein [candidate division Zixibacteria bacterium]MDH4035021.1 GAF domain-containing protein [candidate division Zixibacteria bacterium]
MNTITKEINNLVSWKPWSSGLDDLGVGFLMVSHDGRLEDYNHAASEMLVLDDKSSTEPVHISDLAHVLGSSLNDAVNDLGPERPRSHQRGLPCSNCKGRHMLLDISCLYVGSDDGSFAICFLHDLQRRHHISDDERFLRQELQILSDVAAALSSSSELVQLLKVILTGATASQGLGFNRAFLFMHQEDTNELVGQMAVGPLSAEEAGSIWRNLDAMRLSLEELLDNKQHQPDELSDGITQLITDFRVSLDEESMISRVCRQGEWLNLTESDDLDAVTMALAERLGTNKLALVPMVSKGHLLGLLAADNQITGHPISDEAVHLLQVLANQAAVAMERARLYEAQRERRCELERINTLLAESQSQIIKFEKMSVIGELTSAIAHELRNPLTVVGGFANLMLKAELPEENREYLSIIAAEIKRAESVLHQVLDFSQASKGDNQPIDFSQLVQRSMELLKGRLSARELPMYLSLAGTPLRVFGNYDQLSHAVYQFLKFVAEDLVQLGDAEVRTESKDDLAVMLVKIRCPEDQRDKVRKSLQQIFTQNRTSQRLTILVAGETVRYHGGNLGIACGADIPPSLYIELPTMKEPESETAHTGG